MASAFAAKGLAKGRLAVELVTLLEPIEERAGTARVPVSSPCRKSLALPVKAPGFSEGINVGGAQVKVVWLLLDLSAKSARALEPTHALVKSAGAMVILK